MGKIEIIFDTKSDLRRINADCFVLEEYKIIDGKEQKIIYELYGFTEIKDSIIGDCVAEAKVQGAYKYYVVSEDFEGKLPIDFCKEFTEIFGRGKNNI